MVDTSRYLFPRLRSLGYEILLAYVENPTLIPDEVTVWCICDDKFVPPGYLEWSKREQSDFEDDEMEWSAKIHPDTTAKTETLVRWLMYIHDLPMVISIDIH